MLSTKKVVGRSKLTTKKAMIEVLSKLPAALVVEDVLHEETHECCVCYEKSVPTSCVLKCKHALCKECTGNMRGTKCPMCREELQGTYVTPTIIAGINNRRSNDIDERFRQWQQQQQQIQAMGLGVVVIL